MFASARADLFRRKNLPENRLRRCAFDIIERKAVAQKGAVCVLRSGAKEIGRILARAGRLIAGGLPALLLLDVLYRLALRLLTPLTQRALTWAASRADAGFVTAQGVGLWISGLPLAAVCALSALLYAFGALAEISAILLCLQDVSMGKRCGVRKLFSRALQSAAGAFRPRNLPLLPVLLALAPGLVAFERGAALLTGLCGNGFPARLAGAAGLAAAYTLVFRWALAMHSALLEGKTLRQSLGRSVELLRGRRTVSALGALAAFALQLAATTAATFAASLCLQGIARALQPQRALAFYWSLYTRLLAAGRAGGGALLAICGWGVLSAVRDACLGLPMPARQRLTGRARELAMGQCALFAAVALLFALPGLPAPDTGLPVQVVAHRAGAAIGPENTLSALDEAIRSRAVMAEIDVRQTQDGALVVLHDANLRRVAGVGRSIRSLTLAQARGYDVGSFFSASHAGERIPTLYEMLERARGKIELMIEIKTGRPEAVLAALRDLGMEDQCVLAATDYGTLGTIRQIAPQMRTCYIASSFYGDAARLTAADQLSLRADAVTLSLVREAHASGKEVFCWTVNDEPTMRRMLAYGVDGIITDDPYLASHVAETSDRGLLALTFEALGEREDVPSEEQEAEP